MIEEKKDKVLFTVVVQKVIEHKKQSAFKTIPGYKTLVTHNVA